MKHWITSSMLLLAALAGCNGLRDAAAPIDSNRFSDAQVATTLQTASVERVDLLAMGDWGTGGDMQRQMSAVMARYIARQPVDFSGMLLAGDNFYVSLTGVDDANWSRVFEQMYNRESFPFSFFPSFGNHDYEDGKDLVQLLYAKKNPGSRWTMPGRWYRLDFPSAENPLVTVLMLDSNKGYLGPVRWAEELEWLRNELSKPRRARWLVCCAHHPLYSNGDHGDNGVLQRAWGPLLEQYDADFYVCGHDHDIQHLQLPGRKTTFVLAGGGGAGARPMRIDRRGPFSRSSNGFAHLAFESDHAIIRLINDRGEVVHAARRDVDGTVHVIDSAGSDPATPRTVKSITRPDATTNPSATTQLIMLED